METYSGGGGGESWHPVKVHNQNHLGKKTYEFWVIHPPHLYFIMVSIS